LKILQSRVYADDADHAGELIFERHGVYPERIREVIKNVWYEFIIKIGDERCIVQNVKVGIYTASLSRLRLLTGQVSGLMRGFMIVRIAETSFHSW